MKSKRDAILEGVLEATRLHDKLRTKENIAVSGGRVDVFAAILGQGAELIFKKLEGLLGAYISNPMPGILVTSERPLSIQRFTAAHELGQHWMKHIGSLDDETMLQRYPFTNN